MNQSKAGQDALDSLAEPVQRNQTPRALVLTSQFPNPKFPHWASFNRQQINHLAALCNLALVAPVPWTDLLKSGAWRLPAQTDPYPVRWPIYWYLPRLRRAWHGRAFLWSAWPSLRRLAAQTRPQVLLATWLFPAGWAGMLAARRLGLPLVLKVHGSDVMIFKKDPQRRPYLEQALKAASAVVAVSRSLAREVIRLGAAPERVHLIGNGLDRDMFAPANRLEARRRLSLPPKDRLLLYVGRLAAVKGLDTALRALAQVPGPKLMVVGQGSEEAGLKTLAKELGIAERIIWAGQKAHQEVPLYMAASDAVLLPSLSEGEPNTVLEALGCGRPVVASAVGGVPEVVREGGQGALFEPGNASGLASALQLVLARQWNPDELSAAVADRSWGASAASLLAVLEQAAARGARP